MIAGWHEQTDTTDLQDQELAAYNEGLKRRGSLTVWLDREMTWEAAPTGKRSRQPVYSDAAIQTCLTMKVLSGTALRQTTGFVERGGSVFHYSVSVPIGGVAAG
jgi:hypothetical protein